MAELQNGRSGAEGKGVGIAIVLVVAGTALAVTYVASDGMLFGQAAPAEPSAAASNNGQKNNVDVAGDATPSRNVFEGEPQDVRTSEEEVPAQLPDTSNTATTVTEKVVPEPDRSARTMSDEEMQELLAAKEFPWELVSEHATAADIQNILDEFVQMEQDADRSDLKQKSAELSSGMSFQAANGTLVEIDDPVVAQDNDATLRIGREPEPTLQPENEEVPELEQPDRTIPIPEDGQELRKMIKDILGKQENEDVEEEQKTGDDADDDWDE